MRCISIVRSLYFKIFPASFLFTFRSPDIAMSVNTHYYYYYYYYLSMPALQAGTSRVRFPMVSLELFIEIILSFALWPWGRLSL
jgi:hypothetical protein